MQARFGRRVYVVAVALITFAALAVPLISGAQANHPAGSCLDLEPETESKAFGETHSVTATLYDAPAPNPPTEPFPLCEGLPEADKVTANNGAVLISFEFTGPNDPDGSNSPDTPDRNCVISQGQSSCPITYTANTVGTDTIRGWIDHDQLTPAQGGTTEADTGEAANPSGLNMGDDTEPDGTDVVTRTTTAGPAATLDCDDQTGPRTEQETNPSLQGSASNETYTCTVKDAGGNPVSGAAVNGEVENEVNDPNNPDDGAAYDPADYNCNTNASGSCTIIVTQADGETGTAEICFWVGTPANGATLCPGELTLENAQADGSDTGNDLADQVEKTWETQAPPEANRLDCTPETDTNPVNSSHTITCTTRDAGNAPTAGRQVRAEAVGVNDADGDSPTTPDFSCTTTDTDMITPGVQGGSCSFTHGPSGTGSPGLTTYRAWIESDGQAGDAEADGDEGRDESAQPGTTGEPDDTDVVEKTWEERRPSGLDAEPESDANDLGDQHTITGFVFDQLGDQFNGNTTINFEFFEGSPSDPGNGVDGNSPTTPDKTCTTNDSSTTEANSCSVSYTEVGEAGTDRVCVWVNNAPVMTGTNQNGTCDGEGPSEADDAANEPDKPQPADDDQDVVIKIWRAEQQPTAARVIDCSPETDTNPKGSDHTITCTAQNANGQSINAAGIDIEAVGANDPDGTDSKTSPDFSCTTVQTGSCSIIHGPGGEGTTNASGKTTYVAWIDEDGQNSSSEADAAEGREESAQPGSTTDPEPDGTDVVEKTWQAAPTTITMTPETDSAPVGQCNPFEITAADANGPVQGAIVDVEQRHATANDQTANNEPTVSFCTPTSGSNPSGVDTTKGDLGPNSTAADKEDPDNPGTAGGETAKATDSAGKVTIGIAVAPGQGSDGSGNVTVTAFFDQNDNDDVDGTEPKDDSTKTWQASAARTIDCEPESATTPTTEDHTITCTVKDAAGANLSGESVSFTESGPGEITSPTTGTTNSQGQATVTVSSTTSGTQTITGTLTDDTMNEPDTDECDRAAGDPAGAPAGVCSDPVTNTWTGDEAPECSDGSDNDGDGEIDFPDDPGCDSAEDDSEEDVQDTCPGFANDPRNQIVGTPGDDALDGTSGDDIICGLGGDDTIDGGDGDDLILGGGGKDSIRGNAGADELRAGADDDTVLGGGGDDLLKGGKGKDILRGKKGNDTIRGGGGDDTLRGGAGNDKLNGGKGTDTCVGGPGKDSKKNCEG